MEVQNMFDLKLIKKTEELPKKKLKLDISAECNLGTPEKR